MVDRDPKAYSPALRLRRGEQIKYRQDHHRGMALFKEWLGDPRPKGMTLSLINPESPFVYLGKKHNGIEWRPYLLSTNPDDYAWESIQENQRRGNPMLHLRYCCEHGGEVEKLEMQAVENIPSPKGRRGNSKYVNILTAFLHSGDEQVQLTDWEEEVSFRTLVGGLAQAKRRHNIDAVTIQVRNGEVYLTRNGE